MGPSERQALLDRWMSRHSDAEELRMDRADRMVTAAISAHPEFDGYRHVIKMYAKGSYANQTNVRLDSDVDIVVENRDVFYYDFFPRSIAPVPSQITPYAGRWNDEEEWRAEVTKALQNAFTASQVDAGGKVALTVAEVPGSRPSIDVVPSFLYRRYDSADRRIVHEGSRVFTTTGAVIDNFPAQQKANGIEKDRLTGGRYKKYVRALKSAENYLAEQDIIEDLPSYFMECLVYNVPNSVIKTGYALDEGFKATLAYLVTNLIGDDYSEEDWEEPNGLKYLFRGHKKWSPDDGAFLAFRTWQHLGYAT